jgi:general stress protein 26
VELPAQVRDLLDNEAVIGYLATSFRGVPHVTPVWLDYDSDSQQLLVDVESNTLKLQNAKRNPNVSVSFVAPGDNANWVILKGVIVQIEDTGCDVSHLQTQAEKYLGRPKRNPGHRFILKIKIGGTRWWGEGRHG